MNYAQALSHRKRPSQIPSPITGKWAFQRLHRLDTFDRGVLGLAASMSPLKRQSLFSLLAEVQDEALDHVLRDLGSIMLSEALEKRNARDLLEAIYQTRIPSLFLRLLSRIGDQPLFSSHPAELIDVPRAGYRDLLDLTVSGSEAQKHTLRYCGCLSEAVLRNVQELDAVLLHPTLVSEIRDPELANDVINYIRTSCSFATDDVLKAEFSKVRSWRSFIKMAENFFKRADRFPAPPVPESYRLIPITAASEMVRWGEALSNCLGDLVVDVCVGQRFFYVCHVEDTLDDLPLIAALSPLNDGRFVVRSVSGYANLPVNRDVVREVLSRFAAVGIASDARLGMEVEKKAVLDLLGADLKYDNFCLDDFDID